MSLLLKRRMQERERKNGLSDTVELPDYLMPRSIETQSTQQVTMHNVPMEMENVAYSIPAEISKDMMMASESQIKHAEIENLKYPNTPSWPVAAENYQKSAKDSTLISLPQGAYYDVPIIIDANVYQQQQSQSFNVSPNQQTMPISQIPCTNINCAHCKPSTTS